MGIYLRRSYDVLGCGASTVAGLGDPGQEPEDILKRLLSKEQVGIRFTFYVLADCQKKRVTKDGTGVKFKNYVEKNGLGDILETPGRVKSEIAENEYIKLYVYRPGWEKETFKKWCQEHKVVPVNRGVY